MFKTSKRLAKTQHLVKLAIFWPFPAIFFKREKKIFNRQSLVNPRSAPSPPPSWARLRPSVAPRPRKYPYNASSKRACNIPLPDWKDMLGPPQEPKRSVPPHDPLQDTRAHILFIACVHCCNKRFLIDLTRPVGSCEKPTLLFSHGHLALKQETTRHAELGRIRQRRR